MAIDFSSAPSSGQGSNPFSKKSWSPKPAPAPGSATGGETDFLKSLNPKQLEAATTTDGPLMVLAGAGSGKTKMLTSRIAYLIEARGVPPHQILAVTFTNKAAGEMRERVSRYLEASGALGMPEIGTFHSICVRILRRELDRTPFTKPFVIYDDGDQLSLIKSAMEKLAIDDKQFNPKSMRAGIDRAKCDAIEPHDMNPAPHDLFARKLKLVYEQYQKDLFINNALDFGEILCMTWRLFRDHADIRTKYQHRFRYIHVDEYQDTNRAQYLLLSALVKPEMGGHRNICVVGDEDQSIYKWRGADIKNILDFEHDYPGAAVVKLEQNYRSTQTIINAASQLIRNNRERKDKTLWTANPKGAPITRAQLSDERAEAEYVINEVKKLASSLNLAYSDFSIFYRTHAQSRQFEDVFRREKIPYKIVGGLRFYDRKEIKDVLSYFKVVMNPQDSVSLKRIINTPARGIGKTTIDKLEAYQLELERSGAQDSSLWFALTQAVGPQAIIGGAAAKKLQGFVSLVERLIEAQPRLLLTELYHMILDEIGYVRELRQEATDESLARIENLEEFDTLLQEFEEAEMLEKTEDEFSAQKHELIAKFLEQSALASEGDRNGEDIASVNMMSLHSSKGLEFPVAFLVGMEDGLFPSVRPWEDEQEAELEEERRLCYVGMTRAREYLYLTHVVVRRLWGNVTYQEPARFFDEIPSDAVDFRDYSQGSGGGKYRSSGSSWGGGSTGAAGNWGAGSSSARAFKTRKTTDDFSQINPFEDDSADDPGAPKVGRKIQHPDYGKGTILQLEGAGDSLRVTIEFGGRDRRKFLWRFVKDYLV